MRRAAKTDRNQIEIVRALRQAGASVQPLHMVGEGVPDLLVGFRGVNLVMEVKDGMLPPSRQKLTQDERGWHDSWRGQKSIVADVSQALALLASET